MSSGLLTDYYHERQEALAHSWERIRSQVDYSDRALPGEFRALCREALQLFDQLKDFDTQHNLRADEEGYDWEQEQQRVSELFQHQLTVFETALACTELLKQHGLHLDPDSERGLRLAHRELQRMLQDFAAPLDPARLDEAAHRAVQQFRTGHGRKD